MISMEYKFNGVELSKLTEKGKAECRKEATEYVEHYGLRKVIYSDIMKQTEPAKKIDVATDKIVKRLKTFGGTCLTEDEYKNVIKTSLQEIYGDK